MNELYRCVGCGRDLRKHEVKIRDWGHVKVSLCKACVEDYDRQVAQNHGEDDGSDTTTS